MKIKLDNLTINYIPDDFSSSKIPIMFLHGFTGSSNDWQFLFDGLNDKFTPLAIDLPGHGESSSPEIIDPYLEDSIVKLIHEFLAQLKISSLVICGYSMGGRAALSFAAKYPDKLDGLILESTTAGMDSEDERLQRIKDDNELADRIALVGVENFFDEWYKKPLFKNILENSKLHHKLIEGKKSNDAVGLANTLRGFSTGRMSNHLESLNKLTMPVLLVTGANDVKFSRINENMMQLLPNAEHVPVHSAGHNVHLENEREFIILLNSFLSKL
jgi:2-succinyl-6-hydroxy-2,4-cyclohexadiene-1-carboxylate synthase